MLGVEQGMWVYGKRHGNGTYTYHDGGKYEGEWVDDKVSRAEFACLRTVGLVALLARAQSYRCSSSPSRSTARVPASMPSATR